MYYGCTNQLTAGSRSARAARTGGGAVHQQGWRRGSGEGEGVCARESESERERERERQTKRAI